MSAPSPDGFGLTPGDELFALLPALHRLRDVEQGEPLRALLAVIQSEFDRVDADTAQLYDNWFIETCEEWVVPYLGDLLAVGGDQVAQVGQRGQDDALDVAAGAPGDDAAAHGRSSGR